MTISTRSEDDYVPVGGTPDSSQPPAYSPTDEQGNAVLQNFYALECPTYIDQAAENRGQHIISLPTCQFTHEGLQSGAEVLANTASRGLQVPSCRRYVSSGFPYPDLLSTHGVTKVEWSAFTSEITQIAQLTGREWAVTIGFGIATFCASSLMIGWLGLVPAWHVCRWIQCSTEDLKLGVAKETGDLEARLSRWNQNAFRPKGFIVRLDLAGEKIGDIGQMEVYPTTKWGEICRRSRARAPSDGKLARKCAKKIAGSAKKKSAKRGRIIILPLCETHRSSTGTMGKGGFANQNAPHKDAYSDSGPCGQ